MIFTDKKREFVKKYISDLHFCKVINDKIVHKIATMNDDEKAKGLEQHLTWLLCGIEKQLKAIRDEPEKILKRRLKWIKDEKRIKETKEGHMEFLKNKLEILGKRKKVYEALL